MLKPNRNLYLIEIIDNPLKKKSKFEVVGTEVGPKWGVIKSCGPGRMEDGYAIEPFAEKGEIILFAAMRGATIPEECGKNHIMITEDAIIAIYEEDADDVD